MVSDAQSAPIPDSYWVVPGRIVAGEYPGSSFRETTREKLEKFLDAGIRSFIDLTEAEELRPYLHDLEEMAAVRGIQIAHYRKAIRDLDVPSGPLLEDILDLMDRCASEAPAVYVHCWGGVGRTGTVIGCWLTRNGYTGAGALERIAQLRAGTPDGDRRSPETPAQRRLVLTFGARA